LRDNKIEKGLVSIIIPIYNEKESVFSVIDGIKKVMADSKKLNYELIVVNDSSTDGSEEVILNTENLRIVNNSHRLGYGASIKKGIEASNGSLILIIDADGTYPTKAIPLLLAHTKNHDMVIGARNPNSINMSIARRIARRIMTLLAEILIGESISDVNSGLRVFTREIALRFMHLFPSGFSFTTTLTLTCLVNDYKVKYVKIDYFKREGKSKINPVYDFVRVIGVIIRIIAYFSH